MVFIRQRTILLSTLGLVATTFACDRAQQPESPAVASIDADQADAFADESCTIVLREAGFLNQGNGLPASLQVGQLLYFTVGGTLDIAADVLPEGDVTDLIDLANPDGSQLVVEQSIAVGQGAHR